jgi:hypothetical protein
MEALFSSSSPGRCHDYIIESDSYFLSLSCFFYFPYLLFRIGLGFFFFPRIAQSYYHFFGFFDRTHPLLGWGERREIIETDIVRTKFRCYELIFIFLFFGLTTIFTSAIYVTICVVIYARKNSKRVSVVSPERPNCCHTQTTT